MKQDRGCPMRWFTEAEKQAAIEQYFSEGLTTQEP